MEIRSGGAIGQMSDAAATRRDPPSSGPRRLDCATTIARATTPDKAIWLFTSSARLSRLRMRPDSRGQSSVRRARCFRRPRQADWPMTRAATSSGASKPPPFEQDDSVRLGQPESEIERVDILLQIFNRFVADILTSPELKIDQAIVGVIVRVWGKLKGRCFR